MKLSIVISILLFPVTLPGQTITSLLKEMEKYKTPLFDNSIEDWNKAISIKKKCLITDNGKKINAVVYFGKDSNLLKFKFQPVRLDDRMQICFIKCNDLYFGTAFGGYDGITDVSIIHENDEVVSELIAPPPLPPGPNDPNAISACGFKNIYIYIPGSNDLYLINYAEHNTRNGIDKTYDTVFEASYYMKQLEKYIIAVYYFKADLLGAHKYIESTGAIGIFWLEGKRFQFTEAKRLLPIAYYGAPKDDYDGIAKMFFHDTDLVINAYYTDQKKKTTYTTNFPLDSMQQFDLSRLKNWDMAMAPLPNNSIKFNSWHPPKSEHLSTSFDILQVGRDGGFIERSSFTW